MNYDDLLIKAVDQIPVKPVVPPSQRKDVIALPGMGRYAECKAEYRLLGGSWFDERTGYPAAIIRAYDFKPAIHGGYSPVGNVLIGLGFYSPTKSRQRLIDSGLLRIHMSDTMRDTFQSTSSVAHGDCDQLYQIPVSPNYEVMGRGFANNPDDSEEEMKMSFFVRVPLSTVKEELESLSK